MTLNWKLFNIVTNSTFNILHIDVLTTHVPYGLVRKQLPTKDKTSVLWLKLHLG